ncbi:unnamed protein product, partial [Nesidiocoris tenuis]
MCPCHVGSMSTGLRRGQGVVLLKWPGGQRFKVKESGPFHARRVGRAFGGFGARQVSGSDPGPQAGLDRSLQRSLKEVFLTGFPSEDAPGQAEQGLAAGAYYTCFQSVMAYGILCSGHSAGAGTVFGVQRRAIRVIADLGYRNDCRKDLLTGLNVQKSPGKHQDYVLGMGSAQMPTYYNPAAYSFAAAAAAAAQQTATSAIITSSTPTSSFSSVVNSMEAMKYSMADKYRGAYPGTVGPFGGYAPDPKYGVQDEYKSPYNYLEPGAFTKYFESAKSLYPSDMYQGGQGSGHHPTSLDLKSYPPPPGVNLLEPKEEPQSPAENDKVDPPETSSSSSGAASPSNLTTVSSNNQSG